MLCNFFHYLILYMLVFVRQFVNKNCIRFKAENKTLINIECQ